MSDRSTPRLPDLGGLTILVVDDNEDAVELTGFLRGLSVPQNSTHS
jgi:hypothetical protein